MKRLLRYQTRPWRTGRKVSRTIYAVIGDQPDDHDPLIGVMDTKTLAEAAVRAHNQEILNQERITEELRKLVQRQPRD